MDDEQLQRRMARKFASRGRPGRCTLLFERLPPADQTFLLDQIALARGELPVVGGIESPTRWLLITTRQLVWRGGSAMERQDLRELTHLRSESPGQRKLEKSRLILETAQGDRLLEMEAGGPLFAVWNMLLAVCGLRRQHLLH